MKKIIRLTESDLTKIVQRVLNEQSDKIRKVQLLNLDGKLVSNIELYDSEMKGAKVKFLGNEAGRSGTMEILFDCGSKRVNVKPFKGTIGVPSVQTYKFTDVATREISSAFCSAYSSTGNNVDTSSYT